MKRAFVVLVSVLSSVAVLGLAGPRAVAGAAAEPTAYGFVQPTAGEVVGGRNVAIEIADKWTAGGKQESCLTSTLTLDGKAIPAANLHGTDQEGDSELIGWDARSVSTGTHTLGAKCGANSTTVSISVDSTGDAVRITGPTAGATVGGTSVRIAAHATGDAALHSTVDQVTFSVDGTKVGTDLNAPFAVHWASTSVPNGTHKISVRAVDSAGFVAHAHRTITVDNTATTVTLTAPHHVVYGHQIALRSAAIARTGGAPIAGMTLELFEHGSGGTGGTEVRHGTTDQAGVVDWKTTAKVSASFRVRAVESGGDLASTSTVHQVTVSPALHVALSARHAMVGQTVTVTLRIRPKVAGVRLRLEDRYRGKWYVFEKLRSDKAGSAHRLLHGTKAARSAIRVVALAGHNRAAGISNIVPIRFT